MRLFNKLSVIKDIWTRYSDEEQLLIYQMGKVGSTSLEESLPKAINVHAFYPENAINPIRDKGKSGFGIVYYWYYFKSICIHALIRLAVKQRKKIKIISLIREPIARNLSLYFHDLDSYLYSAHTNCMKNKARFILTRNKNPQFLQQVYSIEFNHNYPFTWFDKEFKLFTGLDIYQYPFDKNKGLGKINTDKYEILLIRLDQLDNNRATLEQFCGVAFEEKQENKAEDKWYGKPYKQFKENFKISNEQLIELKSSKFMQHFFDTKEIDTIIKHYQKS